MTPVQQIIESLEQEPEQWFQDQFTLNHKNGVEIWTANIPYLSIGIYQPKRKINLIEKIQLQRAVNRWNKAPLIVSNKK